MGLDEAVSGKLSDERELFLQGFSDDKVNLDYGWTRALQFDRRPKLNFVGGIGTDFEQELYGLSDRDRHPKKYAIESIKNLMRVAQKVYRTSDRTQIDAYARQMRESSHFSPEDLNLCIPALAIFSKHNNLEKLVNGLRGDLKKMFVENDIKKIMREFNRRDGVFSESSSMSVARSFLYGVMFWMNYYVRYDTKSHAEFNLLAARLNMLGRELCYGAGYDFHQDALLVPAFTNGVRFFASTQQTQHSDILVAQLNNSPEKIMTNDVDCCITGPNGKHRTATMLYWLDPAVYTWEFYALNVSDESVDKNLPFGLGIFFKAEGHHCSKKKSQDYLVLEGFPANVYKTCHINQLNGVKPEKYKKVQKSFPDVSWNVALPNPIAERLRLTERFSPADYQILRKFSHFGPEYTLLPHTPRSLPELIYALGLVTAKSLGIPKLFINTEHSERTQYSVRHSLNEIMRFTGNGEIWNEDTHQLMKDPLTADGSFASFDAHARVYGGKEKVKQFKYTHFLKKSPFPPELVAKIAGASGKWNGEGLFDTFFPWAKFVGSAYRTWPTREEDFDPRAWMSEHSQDYFKDKHGQLEPCWSLGIGYCRGIEVDVQDEWEALENGKALGRTSRFDVNTCAD